MERSIGRASIVLAVSGIPLFLSPPCLAQGNDATTNTFTLTGVKVGNFNIGASATGQKQSVPMKAVDRTPQAMFNKMGSASSCSTPATACPPDKKPVANTPPANAPKQPDDRNVEPEDLSNVFAPFIENAKPLTTKKDWEAVTGPRPPREPFRPPSGPLIVPPTVAPPVVTAPPVAPPTPPKQSPPKRPPGTHVMGQTKNPDGSTTRVYSNGDVTDQKLGGPESPRSGGMWGPQTSAP